MGERKWAEAAALLSNSGVGGQEQFQLNICRNLASLQSHRPAVYAAVMRAAPGDRYIINAAACGHPTIFYRRSDGTQVSLSPGNQPVASLSSTFAAIKANYQAGKPMAVLGIGDGYFLKSCSLHPPVMAFGAQQAVYLFEPDGQAVLASMTLHDYSGTGGPIEQERFHWFVGDDYLSQARDCLIGEAYNPSPVIEISQSPAVASISAGVRALLDEYVTRYRATKARLHAHYAGIPDSHWRDAFTGRLARKPRVLLITTRLSSVLQYSTRDTAEAFRKLGWDALVCIEPKPHHAMTLTKLIEQFDEFRPDMVFQIDHLRSEWRGAIPPSVPFASWIQDHLSNLTSAEAAATVSARDFVLVGMPAMYIERYGYPARQCIELTKLTHIPTRPAAWKEDGDDLVYVSSASQQPVEMVEELSRQFDHSRELSTLVAEACRDQIVQYACGESLPTLHAVRKAFEATEDRLGMKVDDGDMRQSVIDALFDRMSNLLYRQQGLQWAAETAARQGLRLSVYGPGWEKHPTFSKFARGVVKYGADLAELTRRSKINLVLEPFLGVSHQRLLDGLVAGGFFLVRDHPSNSLFPELLDFVLSHAPLAETAIEVRSACARGGILSACNELLARCECLSGYGDVVQIVRDGERAGVIVAGQPTLPSLPTVSFASSETFQLRVSAFLADGASRRRVADRQRVSVEERLSYAAGLKRVLSRIEQTICSERIAQAA